MVRKNLGTTRHENNILLEEGDAVTPPASTGALYATADGLHYKNDSGDASLLSGGPKLIHLDYATHTTNYIATSDTTEQTITGLEIELPILGTGLTLECEWSIAYDVSGSTTWRVRQGTSSTPTSNSVILRTFQSGGRRVAGFCIKTVQTNVDLSAVNYVDATMQFLNGSTTGKTETWTDANSLTVKVYKP